MSKHPKTGKWENACWIDDLFGHHHYGVVFPSDTGKDGFGNIEIPDIKTKAYDPEAVKIETR